MKTGGHLRRNYLLGINGDAINPVLVGAGHNSAPIRRWLISLLWAIFAWLNSAHNSPGHGLRPHQIA